MVNAETMQEMVSDDIGNTAYGLNRLDFEAKVEERLQNKIKNVLTLAYSPDKIRVSATVVIDYDKMITENLEYEPQENGQGVVDHYRESRGVAGGQIGAGGDCRGREQHGHTCLRHCRNRRYGPGDRGIITGMWITL